MQKFSEIATRWDYLFSAALSMNGLYYIWGKVDGKEVIREPKQTELKSFNQIFSHYFLFTYNSIEGKIFEFNDDFINDGLYKNERHIH